MTDIIKRDEQAMAPETMQVISLVVRDMMAPIMESIGKMLEQNVQAMEQIAAAQKITSDRIAQLEKRVRLQTPLSKAQEKCINDAIRARARELLDGMKLADDRRAVTRLGGRIRRSVLARYGVGSLREAPAYDYETAIKQVGMWNDMLAIRDVTKEARRRAAENLGAAGPAAGADGTEAPARGNDPAGERGVPDAAGR